ncbi:hypothetical protein LQ564_20440 [Massilia sp. G4R7]|uniref:Tle cognate immunity protein 4 C-terminal domain-containing protein n=1 Tax=Massilia phyllostachyos TaxID=2898585 RepID=A0ABS8QCM1_9BURK|nr:T6SS immunity protein Tli4 family protein [Massilia phyllostachyos]MCD2518671.1 hypothetical protein [Massilia phyllostachyos]
MMHLILKRNLFHLLFVAGIVISASFDSNAEERKDTKVATLTLRLQSMFEKTKTVCFGRFMVDVPESATTAWGRSSIPLTLLVYPKGIDEVQAEARQFIKELKSEQAVYHDNAQLLISIEEVNKPEGQIVTGYEDSTAISGLRITGYFSLHDAGIVIKARPLSEDKTRAVATIKSMASRVRQRNETDVPTEPGNCIEFGFLPDESGTPMENPGELMEIGFRLKEFPDTHLSIAIRPAHRKLDESNTLEWQLSRLERDLKAENPSHIRLKTKYFRRGKRTIQNWGEGFEVLGRSPEQPEIHSIHDFGMDFQGVGGDPLKPFINVQMQTGIAENEAGSAKPLLSDAEAIAVWDKITSTIRVRPTGVAATKAVGTDHQPLFPLGELASTGRTCPQTGMWESSEASSMGGIQRQYIKAGNVMPRVLIRGEPSLWQKMRGQAPSHQLATIWKLVGYDDETSPPNIAAQTPSTAQVRSDSSATNKDKIDSRDDSHGPASPPDEKG